ncbi:MAG: AarF/ABC1/UbiB kinase family protein [Actinomycetota bacterium]|nr:AarF/ABC1/UbiB kinase family protein [Actinomycetota bacterium]
MTDAAKARHTLLKHSSRVEEVLRVLSDYGFASWVQGVPDGYKTFLSGLSKPELLEMSDGERLRMVCLDLGVTFIKLGQILSTRTDLVGREVADELAGLQGDVPADPPETVHATIESELGKPVDELFASFEDAPLGSASIAQVHAATLTDGTGVVLKVQHPGVEDRMKEDFDILEALAVLAETHDTDLAYYRPAAMVGQLRRSMLAEADFTQEVRNLNQFRANFADEDDVVIPEPFTDLCTRKVLTMSRMPGVPLSSVIGDLGPDGEAFIRRGADIYVEMVFRDGQFHADPHPGNIFVLDGGKVGLLDFGRVGRIDDGLQDEIDDLVISFLMRDVDAVTDSVVRLCDAPPDLDRAALSRDVGAWLNQFGSADVGTVDLQALTDESDAILRRHRLFLPSDVALMMRTLTQLQGLLTESGYDVSISEVLQPYQSMIAAKSFAPERMLRQVKRTARSWERLIETVPDDITAILEGIRRGRLEVPLTIEGLDKNVNRIVYAALAAALFTGSSRLWVAKVPPRVGETSIPGAIGSLTAGAFAFWLLRSAKRDGGIG